MSGKALLEAYENNRLLGNTQVASLVGEDIAEEAAASFFSELDEAAASEDVRRMAEALAPQMSELEDVLRDIATDEEGVGFDLAHVGARTMEDEDDDLDDELKQLAESEQSLRAELEFASDMNNRLMQVPVNPTDDPQETLTLATNEQQPVVAAVAAFAAGGNAAVTDAAFSPPPAPTPSKRRPANEPPQIVPQIPYTLQEHADYLNLHTEKVGGWYYCNMTDFLQPDAAQEEAAKPHLDDLVKDYCLPIPFRKLKRLYGGLMYHEVLSCRPTQNTSTPSKKAPKAANTPGKGAGQPPPPPPPKPQEEPLPVRTVAIRIRPDVLCGAVMDAVHHAFETVPTECTTHILKRQGGHLRGAIYIPDKALAYVADLQLCTQKNDAFERRLIVRFYHIQDDAEAMNELGTLLQQQQQTVPESSPADTDAEKTAANRHIKQSCSLIQRLMAAQQRGGAKNMDSNEQYSWLGLRDTSFDSKDEMRKAIGTHLESTFKSCPSVREENKKATPTIRRLTLPSLSTTDWPLLEASWSLTTSIFEELDTRDCSYNTLATLRFGQFPSLPTLDVHYCSQLRRLSRDSMVGHLLKSAKDLEDYARSAEYNCAICITLLEPMLEFYGIPALDLPRAPKPLQDYPLDWISPQISCPPWGKLVMDALNDVSAKTTAGEMQVDEAVKLVYDSFIRQDDEEQSARLGRKNAQIMERLASLQSHQRALVQNIRDAHVYSEKASLEAEEFLKRAKQARSVISEGSPSSLQAEVPLLSFRISLGASSSGICYVTANHVLFVTSVIPLVGGKRTSLFDLGLVDFKLDESGAQTILNPFPNTMKMVSRSDPKATPLFSFRPSLGPARLLKFLQVIQSFVGDTSNAEFSQVHDSSVVEEDGVMRLTETTSEDQLSI